MSMKSDAECNKTSVEIMLYRFDEYNEILTKMTSKSRRVTSKIVKLKKNKDRYGISDLYKDGDRRGHCRFNVI